MERDIIDDEESVDSIPPPEYEAIATASGKSTPTLAPDKPVVVTSGETPMAPTERESHIEEEDDGNYDDAEEDGNAEEKIEEENGEAYENTNILTTMPNKTLPPLTISTLANVHKQQLKLVSPSAGASHFSFVISNKRSKVNENDAIQQNAVVLPVTTTTMSTDSVPLAAPVPVPVQILAVVPAVKTKINKMTLEQMAMDENSSGEFAQADITNSVLESPEQLMVSSKLISPIDDKTAHNNQLRTGRSSTPLSREFLALQRSVHESKILSEFVTDPAVVKPRTRRKSGILSHKESPTEATPPLLQRRKSITSSAQSHGGTVSQLNSSVEKVRHMGKLIPLKDGLGFGDECELKPMRRSRSKSMHRKSPVAALESGGVVKLKRWPSDEKILKRTNMRSQNSEFVQKQKEFLNRVRDEADVSEGDDEEFLNGEDEESRLTENTMLSNSSILGSAQQSGGIRQNVRSDSLGGIGGSGGSANVPDVDYLGECLEAVWQPPPKRGWDSFCWKCRDCGDMLPCSKCARSFHSTCIKATAATKLDNTWICPECLTVENVINGPKRSRRNELSLDLLGQLLSFALKRMKNVKGYLKFLYTDNDLKPYSKYLVNPVTFTTLQEKIEKRSFRCAEEFLNETKWLLHNALILSNGISNSKEALTAKAVLKICRQETNEIDTCAECYLNANTRSDWFVDVCAQPHLILWAKLKGFPYWPAKAMGPGQGSHVNVRFFGEHDRAFVPIKDCFLYSLQDPNTQTGKRSARELADCIKEVEKHIEKIKAKVGAFKYATYKTPYDPGEEMQQLEQMMPGVTEYMKRQQTLVPKPPLQYKIVKTADNHLSIIKKAAANESGNDSDHSGSPGKKSKSEICDSKVTTTKYEVVSKATSEDSNSSKVSAVILKRKSVGHESKKSEEPEPPLPKMTKIVGTEDGEPHLLGSSANSTKRKHATATEGGKGEGETERQKSKHSKHSEPRVRLQQYGTIKTNGSKAAMEAKQPKEPKEATTENEAQSMMEHLVKNKQGVTIKKISKETSKQAGIAEKATEPQAPTVENKTDAESPVTGKNDGTSTTASNSAPKKHTNILKDLVPFVEIKKEITSDDEEPANAVNNASGTNSNVNTNTTNHIQVPLPLPSPSLAVAQSHAPTDTQEQILLTTVKQEIMSDDEEQANAPIKDNNTGLMNAPTGLVTTEKSIPSLVQSESVRVVGDTTIQRIPGKGNNNVVTQSYNQSMGTAIATNTAANATSTTPTHGSNVTQSQILGKRTGSRGVPYGPLPASATPAVKTSGTANNGGSNANMNSNALQSQQQQQQQPQLQQSRQGQRARKSFPNRSSADVSPARTQPIVAPAQLQANVATTVSNSDLKRPLLKTSMVSIPRQVWSPMDPAQSSRSVCNSIPVPPLTAVSKHSGPINANNESNNNNVNQPTVDVITASNHSNCNGGVGGSGSGSAALLTPLSMNAPPPLAGLSQPTISMLPPSSAATILPNSSLTISLPSNASATFTGDNNQSVCSSTPSVVGIANTDFVTPTLAAMVTDAICRGPPKMAARPNGPLQSDGGTLFPSQAGPVCRTLVENAHKLTDFFISVMEDTMLEMSVGDESVLQAKITLLTMELERRKQAYEQEIAELKRTSDLMLCEMRKSMENEKTRLANEIRKQCELERLRSIEETKKKQWCANCGREAQFYCCWNTSYCDYPCQQLHWSRHAPNCAQTRPASSSNDTSTAAVVGCKQQQTNTSPPYKTVISSKKDKSSPKCSQSSTMNAGAVAAGNLISTSTSGTEMLKLPSNTFVRTVPQIAGANARTAGSAFAVQRFNIPLPITAPVNAPPPYTLVQRGNNWELTSAAPANSNSSQAMNSANISAVAASGSTATPAIAQLSTHQQQQQQQSTRHNNVNMSQTKSSGRTRTVQQQQQSISNMQSSTLQCNVLRPSHM